MDKNKFSCLYDASRKELYGYCRNLCGNSHDAYDLMQQTYLKAWENFGKFDGRNFPSWLCSVARNIFLNNLRKSKPEYFTEELHEIPDNSQNPEFVAEKRDICRILLKALKDSLSPVQRATVIFYYYDEKSVSEIADIMKCSKGTVESRLFSARKKLREELKKFGNIFTCLSLATATLKYKLKNIQIPINARITASAVLTVTAMTAVSMTNIPYDGKLPDTVITISEGSDVQQKSKPIHSTTENKEESTMKKEIISAVTALTTAFSATTAVTGITVAETAPCEPTTYGDANLDNDVTISDSVAVLQFIANTDKYPLDEEATTNADVYNPGDGVTGNDANSIMKFEAGTIESLPEYPETTEEIPTVTTMPAEEETMFTTTTTTAPINPNIKTKTRGYGFEEGYYLMNKEEKWYDNGAEYEAEFEYRQFKEYEDKLLTGKENLISDTDLYNRINSALPYNVLPYLKTELEKITTYESNMYGTCYATDEKLPDLLRICSVLNGVRRGEQWLIPECAEIINNEFSDYVTGPYDCTGVITEEYKPILKCDNFFDIPDHCWHYYFISSDHEENTRIAEEIISRIRQAMNEKYGDIAITDGDIWLDCHGIETYSERGLDERINKMKEHPELYIFNGCHVFHAIRSTKNIYFPADSSEPVTYWDIS